MVSPHRLTPPHQPAAVAALQAVPSLTQARGFGAGASDRDARCTARLQRSLSIGAPACPPALRLPAPPAKGPAAPSPIAQWPVIAVLPSQFDADQMRHTFAELEHKIHQQMSPWAREGVAILANIGKSISLGVGAVAAWLGFVLAEPHLALVVGVAGAVWAGSILIGIVLELTLKYFACAKVDAASRDKLTALCIELNAREKELGSHRHLDEQHTCDQANRLWAQIHFRHSTLATTLLSSVTDYPLQLPRPAASAVLLAPTEKQEARAAS